MKKILVFDMDGTLLNSERKILKESANAIKKAKAEGHKFAIASGRGWKSIKQLVDHQFDVNPFDFYVCHNGAYVRDLNKEQNIIVGKIPSQLAADIVEATRAWEHTRLVNVHTDNDDFTFLDDKGDAKPRWKDEHNVDSLDEIIKLTKENEIVQVGIITMPKDNPSVLKELTEKFGDELYVSHPGEIFVDINSKGVDKYIGILTAAEITHIDEDHIVVFGDANNDLPMFEKAKTSIAMSNATPEILSLATEIIGNNDEPSIANWMAENL